MPQQVKGYQGLEETSEKNRTTLINKLNQFPKQIYPKYLGNLQAPDRHDKEWRVYMAG